MTLKRLILAGAGFIDAARLEGLAANLAKSGYGAYLFEILRGEAWKMQFEPSPYPM
jgi:hypothetical protein